MRLGQVKTLKAMAAMLLLVQLIACARHAMKCSREHMAYAALAVVLVGLSCLVGVSILASGGSTVDAALL